MVICLGIVPDRLVDADIHARQIAETSDEGLKGAVPFLFGVSIVDGYVQVEASYCKGFSAGTEAESREQGGLLEGECVGGVDEVPHVVIDLSTRAEEGKWQTQDLPAFAPESTCIRIVTTDSKVKGGLSGRLHSPERGLEGLDRRHALFARRHTRPRNFERREAVASAVRIDADEF